MPLVNISPALRAQLAGMGLIGADESMAPQGADAALNEMGLPPQDLINSLYDIFGSYPRKNVLPYANGFSLVAGSQYGQLGAGATLLPTVQTTSDAAHIVTHITGASTGDYSISMRTDSSDRQLMTIPVHSAAMVGTGELPFKLPKPLMLAPNTTVSFQIVDLSGNANDVYFTLWGFKVYRRQYAAG